MNIHFWEKGSGVILYNGSETSKSDLNLNSKTTRYYKAWSYNSTDNNWSILFASCNATTDNNNAPAHYMQTPTNC